jgi:hypothetical protein
MIAVVKLEFLKEIFEDEAVDILEEVAAVTQSLQEALDLMEEMLGKQSNSARETSLAKGN